MEGCEEAERNLSSSFFRESGYLDTLLIAPEDNANRERTIIRTNFAYELGSEEGLLEQTHPRSY